MNRGAISAVLDRTFAQDDSERIEEALKCLSREERFQFWLGCARKAAPEADRDILNVAALFLTNDTSEDKIENLYLLINEFYKDGAATIPKRRVSLSTKLLINALRNGDELGSLEIAQEANRAGFTAAQMLIFLAQIAGATVSQIGEIAGYDLRKP